MFKKSHIKTLQKYTISIASIFIAITIYLITYLTHFEIFEEVVEFLESVEKYELDEILILLFVIATGFSINMYTLRKNSHLETKIKSERLNVLKNTMRTVMDIVNNSLNNLQLIKLHAQKNRTLSDEDIQLLDKITIEVSRELKILSDLQETPEIELATGLFGIDYKNKREKND